MATPRIDRRKTDPRRDTQLFYLYLAFQTLTIIIIAAGFSFNGLRTHWVYVALYLLAAVYAVAHRSWLAFAVAVSLVAVRAMVALSITGIVFELVSAIFANLFFILVIKTAREPTTDFFRSADARRDQPTTT